MKGIFWEKSFGRVFLEGFCLGGFCLGGFFGRDCLVDINKELIILSRFWDNFVSMEGKKEGGRTIRQNKDHSSAGISCFSLLSIL